MTDLKMYTTAACWWPILSDPSEYVEEAAFAQKLIVENCAEVPVRLLELGSGGGNNASHLRARFTMTLVELSPAMVEVSQALNPDCEHLVGDMRSVRLNRLFDAVFIHDAIMYMTTEDDLRAALETAFVHCRPGGVALFEPDVVQETFAPETDHGGNDSASGSLRYLAWSWDPDPGDTTFVTDYALLFRGSDGEVQIEHDRHLTGLFSRDTWLRLLRDVGFDPFTVPDPWRPDNFIAKRPALSNG